MERPRRFVIAGGGRVGLQTAQTLSEQGHDVVLIDQKKERADELSDEYLGPVIHGDATDPSILQQAKLTESHAIAALTDHTGTNLQICMEAERIVPSIRTIARAETPTGEQYEDLVEATVLPQDLSGSYAADLLTGEEVRTLVYPTADLDIIEVTVTESAPAAGKRLDQVGLPRGSLVISTGERTKLANSDTAFEPGTSYILAVESDVLDEVLDLLRG